MVTKLADQKNLQKSHDSGQRWCTLAGRGRIHAQSARAHLWPHPCLIRHGYWVQEQLHRPLHHVSYCYRAARGNSVHRVANLSPCHWGLTLDALADHDNPTRPSQFISPCDKMGHKNEFVHKS
jgi:hypothetical protein